MHSAVNFVQVHAEVWLVLMFTPSVLWLVKNKNLWVYSYMDIKRSATGFSLATMLHVIGGKMGRYDII